MKHFIYTSLLSFLLVLAVGCGGDSTSGSGADGGGGASCSTDMDCDDGVVCNGTESCVLSLCGPGEDAADGTSCTELADGLCIGGLCANSVCGDGYQDADAAEECDDGNLDAGDGCEPDCTLTCSSDTDCDDGNPCNGAEQCEGTGATATCAAGTDMADGTPCGMEQACRGGACISIGCGDGTVDPGEQCDDGNMVEGDGCDSDCSWSCSADDECDDGDVCNGTETCDIASHTCNDPADLDCTASDACHMSTGCDSMLGCQEVLIDGDMDGHAALSLGACGDDCNDSDDTIYDGAAELCDGEDNDCDTAVDEGNPVWHADCDSDGYGPLGATSVVACTMPTTTPRSCRFSSTSSQWTSRVPVLNSTADCNDGANSVNPTHTDFETSPHDSSSYDWNCNGTEEKEVTAAGVSTDGLCVTDIFGSRCTGAAGWSNRSAPACGSGSSYSSCSNLSGRCLRTAFSRIQACR